MREARLDLRHTLSLWRRPWGTRIGGRYFALTVRDSFFPASERASSRERPGSSLPHPRGASVAAPFCRQRRLVAGGLAAAGSNLCSSCYREERQDKRLDHRRHGISQEGRSFGRRRPAILRSAWQAGLGSLDVFQEPRAAAGGRYRRQAFERGDGAAASEAAAQYGSFLGRWHADRSLGIDDEFSAERRIGRPGPAEGGTARRISMVRSARTRRTPRRPIRRRGFTARGRARKRSSASWDMR